MDNANAWAVAQLRHFYAQLYRGQVKDQKQAAMYLLGPAIVALEERVDHDPAVKVVKETG